MVGGGGGGWGGGGGGGRGGVVVASGGASDLIRMRFSPDVCSYCVSRNTSISVARRDVIVACRDLSSYIFFQTFEA